MKNLYALGLMIFCLGATSVAARGEGFLPPMSKSTSTVVNTAAHEPLLIGDEVPGSLQVIDESGNKRSLVSYKSYLEVLVVTFFSPRCEEKESEWPRFRRMNDHYKDWRVAFLAVNTSAPEMLPELTTTLNHEKIFWPTVQDDNRKAAALLNITGTPEVLVLDESGVLQYRGPIDGAPAALDAVIGHVDAVAQPEPPFKGACAL